MSLSPWGARYEGGDWLRIDLVYNGPMDWVNDHGDALRQEIGRDPNGWLELIGPDGLMCLSTPPGSNTRVKNVDGPNDSWFFVPRGYAVDAHAKTSRVLVPVRARLCLLESVSRGTYVLRVKPDAGMGWAKQGLLVDHAPRTFEMTRNTLEIRDPG